MRLRLLREPSGARGGVFLISLLLLVSIPDAGGAHFVTRPPMASPGGAGLESVEHASQELTDARASIAAGAGPDVGGSVACPPTPGTEIAQCRALASSDTLPPLQTPPTLSGWHKVGGSPRTENDSAMTYDDADGYVLYLGTVTGTYWYPGGSATWAFTNGSWSPITTVVAPSACPGSAMTYDAADSYVLYFAAYNCTSAGQTWMYRASVWTQLHPASGPSVRQYAGMAYSPSDGYVVLFGGRSGGCASCLLGDTWKFVAGNWTDLNATLGIAPSARYHPAMAYDPAESAIVLFSGRDGPDWWDTALDTWEFSNGAWQNLTGTGAPPTYGAGAMAYDSLDGYLINFGSWGEGPNFTWSFQAGTWKNITATSGAAPPPFVMTPTRPEGGWAVSSAGPGQGVVLFGEGPPPGYSAGHTWEFSSGSWHNASLSSPIPRTFGSMAYDALDGYVLLFGGLGYAPNAAYATILNETWTYRAGAWTRIFPSAAPSPRDGAGLAYDAADHRIVLFGGMSSSCSYDNPGFIGYTFNVCNDTWTFASGQWSRLSLGESPSNRTQSGMVYDAADSEIVLYGGYGYTDSFNFPPPLKDTWVFQGGAWANVTPAEGSYPDFGPGNQFVYDAGDGYAVLFGGHWGTLEPINYTWSFHGGAWTNRSSWIRSPPPGRIAGAMAYDTAENEVVLFGGEDSYITVFDDTWVYHDDVWARVTTATGPTGRAEATLVDDPADGYALLLGGESDYYGGPNSCRETPCPDGWIYESRGLGPFVVVLNESRSSTDVGFAVILNSLVLGGGPGPLHYAYSNLPLGCSSSDSSSISCTPVQAGVLTVTVRVTNASQSSTDGQAQLTVNDVPRVTDFHASPSPVAQWQNTTLSVTISGGTGPFHFSYTGLPSGCYSGDRPTIPCTPSVSGPFTVAVTVVDSVGASTQASTTLTVVSTIPASPLSISEFLPVPASVALGGTVSFVVITTGGSGAVSYSFVGLPPGCTSYSVPILTCVPTSAGTFQVRLVVTDEAGGSSSAVSILSVLGAPVAPDDLVVQGVLASPSAIVLGESTVFEVLQQGGVAPFDYAYYGLPPGCSTSSTSTLACTPLTAGTFWVTVSANDSNGGRGTSSTLLVVGTPVAGDGGDAGATSVPAGPSWLEFGLGILVAVLASALAVALALRRQSPPRVA